MTLKLSYNPQQKKRASTMWALAKTEAEAAELLVKEELYRESVIHLYFSCFYLSQTFLIHNLGKSPPHNKLNDTLRYVYEEHENFPLLYINLHSFLYDLRLKYSYKHAHTPPPELIKRKLRILKNYIKFSYKNAPKINALDIIKGVYSANNKLAKDISYDIYCPKTYSHHTRLTFWHPPFYLEIFDPKKVFEKSRVMLKSLKVKRYSDYVLGINSRIDQYKHTHLIMFDIDTFSIDVESSLKEIGGGVLMKSGRGLHFIGNELVIGRPQWEKKMRGFLRHSILKNCLDKDHVKLSIQRGYSTLRITKSPVKPFEPIFLKEI